MTGLPDLAVEAEANPKRMTRLLARLRRRQLDHALRGRFADSAKYANRARRVRSVPGRHAG
ncbi:MAG: hypothetical protein AAF750_17525 [Planctomycetota bacterium]